MSLSIQDRVEIVLLSAREGWSQAEVAVEFNRRHPDRALPLHQTTVGRLFKKFKETGSVADRPKPGRPTVVTEEMKDIILAKVSTDPTKSLLRHAQELDLSYTTCWKVLKKEKFRPYKPRLLQVLFDEDFDRRSNMCEWFLHQLNEDQNFLKSVMFTDEANFYVNGLVSKHHLRYWSNENPHFSIASNLQGGPKVMVWLGVFNCTLVGPFFFQNTVTGESYLQMLGDQVLPHLDAIGERPTWFQQDGAPPHFAHQVRHWLDENFANSWIGRGGPVEWSPRSPDLNPLDFCLWGYLKRIVYREPIRNLAHLQARILESCQNLPQDMLHNVEENMKRRLASCFNVAGAHFEHLM